MFQFNAALKSMIRPRFFNGKVQIPPLAPPLPPLVSQKISPTGMDSHVLRGKEYEILCCSFLQKTLGIECKVIGGACDEGVDLYGRWHIVWRPSDQYSTILKKEQILMDKELNDDEKSLKNILFGIKSVNSNTFIKCANTDPLPLDAETSKEIIGDGEQFNWKNLKDASEFPFEYDNIYKEGLTLNTSKTSPFPEIVVQCKRQTQSLAPSVVREMEGTLGRFGPSHSKGEGVIGIIMSTMPSSPSTKKAIMSSLYPILFLQFNPTCFASNGGGGGGEKQIDQELFESFMNCRLESMIPNFVIGRRFIEGKERPQMYIVALEPREVSKSTFHDTLAAIKDIDDDDEYS